MLNKVNVKGLIKLYLDDESINLNSISDIENFSYEKVVFVRPVFVDKSSLEEVITFPWCDTYLESKTILESLLSDEDGIIFSDADQGWDLTIEKKGEEVFFVEKDDVDGNIIHCGIINRQEFLLEINNILSIIESILNKFETDII